MTPCKRCNAPCPPDHKLCSLCEVQYLQGHGTAIETAGESGGLEQLVSVAGQLRYSDEKFNKAWKAMEDDKHVAGKCVLVRPSSRGLDRCLAPAVKETVDGERCCLACWEARGGR